MLPFLIMACIVATFASCDGKVEGVVRLAGNEPFTSLQLELADGSRLSLEGAVAEELLGFQNRKVRVEGTLLDEKPIKSALPPRFEVLSYALLD